MMCGKCGGTRIEIERDSAMTTLRCQTCGATVEIARKGYDLAPYGSHRVRVLDETERRDVVRLPRR